MEERILESSFDNIRDQLGIILLKPDAVEEDLTEFFIAHVASRLFPDGQIAFVKVIDQLDGAQIKAIYPNDIIGTSIYNFLSSGSCVIATFLGRPGAALESRIKKLKGKRMRDWTPEDFDNSSVNMSLRGIIPLPGFRKLYEPIFIKLRNNVQLSEEEFSIYCRNFVHSPEGVSEYIGLLNQFTTQELGQFLSPIQLDIISQYSLADCNV